MGYLKAHFFERVKDILEMKLFSPILMAFAVATGIDLTVPDDAIEIPVRPCNTVGPMDKTAEEVPALGKVNRVSVEKCQFVGKTCGLVRGDSNAVYIEYTLDNAKEKFNGKRVRKFPRKENKNLDFQATIDVCGYLQGMGNICAPFSLPDVDACTQGLNCTMEGSKIPRKKAELEETRVIKVELPINPAYPTVKVISKWEVTDQTYRKNPKLFCMYLPLAVV